MKYVYIILGLIVILGGIGFWFMQSYNALVTKNEAVRSAWAQVDNNYQRRLELIPNLVATVEGASDFEKSTLTAVTEARAKVSSMQINPTDLGPEAIAAYDANQGALSSALGRLLVTVESYPQLKSVVVFQDLVAQLEGTENRIATARRDYSNQVEGFNATIKRFPGSIVASFAGFEEKGYFTADAGAEEAPKVDFSN